jgi:hypothetical protein
MHEIKVLVRLEAEKVDEEVPVTVEDMQDAAAEAVENAVRAAFDMGFAHRLADKLCIGFVDAVLYEDDRDIT